MPQDALNLGMHCQFLSRVHPQKSAGSLAARNSMGALRRKKLEVAIERGPIVRSNDRCQLPGSTRGCRLSCVGGVATTPKRGSVEAMNAVAYATRDPLGM